MSRIIDELKRTDHKRYLGGLDFFKYIGPGLLVTVGFIDPGNWASNFAAGSEFGYALLWVVTLSTIMLIVLQHNVAHLGIVTGLCLSEAATQYCPKWISRPILGSAVLASISTSLAEILGGAIALQMLLEIPIAWGSVLTTMFVVIMLFSNSYKKIERAIIAFVSVIGQRQQLRRHAVNPSMGAPPRHPWRGGSTTLPPLSRLDMSIQGMSVKE
jgi:manganese transport protein